MKRILYILSSVALLLSFQTGLSAQEDRREVRQGNRKFRKEAYDEAVIEYLKAVGIDSTSVAANYNLANTLYRQGDHANAQKALERVKETAPKSAAAADYFFNMGDVAIAQQDWKTAVEAFMQSLLLNPGDLQAKENYIYARKKLEDQQQNQQGQDQNDDQNQQDQNQDNPQDNDEQNQNDQNDQQDRNDQQNEDQQDESGKDRQQEGRQPEITPQAAQQMLQAIQAKEKETQDKVNKAKAAALKSRQKEKNW